MLTHVANLIADNQLHEALGALKKYLNANPDDPEGIFLLGVIMMETDNPAIGKIAFEHLLKEEHYNWNIWNNYGRCLDNLYLYEEAAHAFFRAFSIKQNNLVMENISMNAVHRCLPDIAIKYAHKVLAENPGSISARLNLGFSHLMKGEFDPGWREFECGVGAVKWRDSRNYTGEPVWNGEKASHVIVYGEQGIGDQIAMAGPIQQMRRDCKSITLDVHKKLEGLFRRSFLCPTHGTMFETELEWPFEQQVDYSCALSQIQKFYRDQPHKFTGEPYLIPDIIRKKQWKRTLEDMGDKPKVGIAWTGGGELNAMDGRRRSTNLNTFFPFMDDRIDWISLEYRDSREEIERFHVEHNVKVHDFPWATQTNDYDDTAALVSELDLVISVPTSVVHLAGALGIPCWCIVHDRPHFMFGLEGDSMPYYNSVKLFRRGSWEQVISKIQESIRGLFDNHTDRTRARRSS